MAMVQNQWYHFGEVHHPFQSILVGIGMFTGGTIWALTHRNIFMSRSGKALCRLTFSSQAGEAGTQASEKSQMLASGSKAGGGVVSVREGSMLRGSPFGRFLEGNTLERKTATNWRSPTSFVEIDIYIYTYIYICINHLE